MLMISFWYKCVGISPHETISCKRQVTAEGQGTLLLQKLHKILEYPFRIISYYFRISIWTVKYLSMFIKDDLWILSGFWEDAVYSLIMFAVKLWWPTGQLHNTMASLLVIILTALEAYQNVCLCEYTARQPSWLVDCKGILRTRPHKAWWLDTFSILWLVTGLNYLMQFI